ncbi:hypothetical protein CCHR01_06070 [Colletotrichum chrysophilum]|uniref:Uncharacterized protein n=1 Tax=Colletotrichum chrysophilum TaxID=1836956 RepID=A0AAD9EK26_9PEZI|nr:hypothetical protein CCHR01_06070 [Colletotrichum chrysophilum]
MGVFVIKRRGGLSLQQVHEAYDFVNLPDCLSFPEFPIGTDRRAPCGMAFPSIWLSSIAKSAVVSLTLRNRGMPGSQQHRRLGSATW